MDDVDFQGRRIQELADIFIPPEHRGKEIATTVVCTLVTPENRLWLLGTIRKDLCAEEFWRRNLPKMGVAVELPVGE